MTGKEQNQTGSESLSLTTPPIALTIAGFDPSSGAGITADLKTFAAHGLYGISCATALTIQSTQGVRGVVALGAELVAETLACLQEDMTIAGIKIGMLGSAEVAGAVADFLAQTDVARSRIVLDPVLRSSSGAVLLEQAGLRVMRERLLGLVGWVTPNLDELAVLAAPDGVTRNTLPAAAHRLQAMAGGAGNGQLQIVVTGGHLDRPDDYYLEAGEEGGGREGRWIAGERVETSSTHGTGCAFSSALAAQLMQDCCGLEAVIAAKRYVTEALRSAYPVGKGRGPLHHLYRFSKTE